MDIADWLRKLGLEQYESAFADNHIDGEVLPSLTTEDLKDLGIASVGHRRTLLDAIALLRPRAEATPPSGHRPATVAEAERRQLTVMFCDLVGSTELAARLDVEDLREVIAAYHRSVAETVGRFDGFVAKYMGDGVLVYFGYPQAHEDDAERAVTAGLDLVASVAGVSARAAQRCRIGIATGLVVVGDLIGVGAAREQAVVGETPNLASRLQALASPGAVVIADATRRLIGNLFECRSLGTASLKGFAEPVPAWEVLHRGVVTSRFEAMRAGALVPIVGRKDEIDLIARRWHQARGGEGRVVLLSGEPGIGKSRIIAAIDEELRGEPHARLTYFCSPHRQDSVLFPFIDQLQRAAGFARDDTAEAKLDRLEAWLSPSPEGGAETAALLADLLDLPTHGRHPQVVADPQRKRELTFAALMGQLDRGPRRLSVLMVFEDAHWIDPTSRELLDRIVHVAARLPLLLVVTARPEFQAPWSSAPQVTVLALSRLGAREGRALAEHVAGGKRLPDEIVAQIVDRTDGVPLFVEELTKTVLESGCLREENGGFALDGPLPPLAIPTSLHGSLMARLDRLGPAKQIAQFGAAIGRQFSHELLEAIAQLPGAELGEGLDQLVGSELVFRRGVPPRADYVFKHALVQDAAYSTLLRTRRQELHARIAAVLEVGHDIAPEMLAHHFGEAGAAEKAAHHWLEAGRRALRRSATTEAITHLTKGLGALTGRPDSDERARSELKLQLALGPALSATRGWNAPEAERAYRRAELLAQGLGADRERFDAVWGLWMIHNTGDEPEIAREITSELFQIADQLNDPALRMEAHHAAWACASTLGDYVATIEHMRQGLAIYESEKHGAHAFSYGGHDAAVCGKGIGGRSLWALGYPDQAIRSTNDAITFAETLGHAPSLAHALLFAALCHQSCRDAVAVLDITDRLITLATGHRLTLYLAVGGVARGWALAQQGQLDQGLAELQRNLEAYEPDKPKSFSLSCRAALAEVYLKAGDAAQALHAVDSAVRASERTGVRGWLAAVLHLKGEVLASMAPARWPDAEMCFMEALQVARTQEAKSLELRAATGLARLWWSEGRGQDARDLLAPVYGWFTEGFDTPDLRDAKALLDEFG
jgi:class 3 adenylate cyclase/predicted ATPase